MKRTVRQLKKRVYQTLDLPAEADGVTVRLTVVGRSQLLVENHGGVLLCERTHIRLHTSEGVFAVFGEELSLAELTESRAFIRGRFSGCAYEDARRCGIP